MLPSNFKDGNITVYEYDITDKRGIDYRYRFSIKPNEIVYILKIPGFLEDKIPLGDVCIIHKSGVGYLDYHDFKKFVPVF